MNPDELRRYTGPAAFDRPYRVMLENGVHAPGSVDRVLVDRMIRLVPGTAEYLYGGFSPRTVDYRPGSRPDLERWLAEATAGAITPGEKVKGIAEYCLGIRERFEKADPDDSGWEWMVFGGTEEQIIERGTDWCADLARAACALCQVAGLPARIVNLVELDAAYGGHVIIEAWRDGIWGAVDPLHGILYTNLDGGPMGVRDLLGLDDYPYQAAAITNYFISASGSYSYTVCGLGGNDYYRSILEMAVKGWPGGRRWLFNEDGPGGG